MKRILLGLLTLMTFPLVAAERVMVYSQYDYPPFWNLQQQGLTVELAKELTRLSAGRYDFHVQITPRKRIDAILDDESWQGIIPWVSPIWFRDVDLTRYAWSEVLVKDADLVVSYQPMDYVGPDSLIGKTLGGILGHQYVELDSLIASGKVKRDDALSQEGNLKKLNAKRVDFVFIPNSSWGELKMSSPQLVQGLFVANIPRNRYERRILISPRDPALVQFVSASVEQLSKDANWKKKLDPFRYQYP